MQTVFFLDVLNCVEGQTFVTLGESGLAWLGCVTQPHHKAPGNLWVENIKTQ